MQEQQYCAVFCGSRLGKNAIYRTAALDLADSIADHQWGLVYGGGKVGLMGVIAQAVLDRGAPVIGVIPHPLNTEEVAFDAVTELIYVQSMHERKTIMADRANAFVAIPGGFGTMDELFEILTWAQLGIHNKPIVLFNVAGFYDALIQQLDYMVEEELLKSKYRDYLMVAESVDEVWQKLETYQPGPLNEKWLRSEQR